MPLSTSRASWTTTYPVRLTPSSRYVLKLELALADLEGIEAQLAKRLKAARADKSLAAEVEALEAAAAALAEGRPIYRAGLDANHRELLRPWFLLTNKPVLAVSTWVSPTQRPPPRAGSRAEFASGGEDVEVLSICAQLEAEVARLESGGARRCWTRWDWARRVPPARPLRLPPAGAAHILDHRRQGEPGVDVPGRRQGPRVRRRDPLRPATGLHLPEVIRWDELLSIGSWTKAKEAGKLHVEGKDYEVVDGNMLEIRSDSHVGGCPTCGSADNGLCAGL